MCKDCEIYYLNVHENITNLLLDPYLTLFPYIETLISKTLTQPPNQLDKSRLDCLGLYVPS